MNLATATWFTIGACLVYAVAVDANVYPWLVLQAKRLKLETERAWFRVRYHPDSLWIRYEIKRNSDRIAAEFIKENENR